MKNLHKFSVPFIAICLFGAGMMPVSFHVEAPPNTIELSSSVASEIPLPVPEIPQIDKQPLKKIVATTTAHVTAYSSVDSCHYPGCIMANGKSAQVGYVACPRKLKLGTKVLIDGEEYTCGDRTAKRFDGRYDIFKGYGADAHKKAIEFGIKVLEVEVLE